MKKSKSSSNSKKRKRSDTPDTAKRYRSRSRSKERKKTLPRKTRWHTEETDKEDTSKRTSPAESSEKKTKSSSSPFVRIKDLLDDKEKIVEHLFLTITGDALQDLIPDYLKKRSNEELKKLCLEELKKMPADLILHILSGKDPVSYCDSAKQNLEKEVAKPGYSSVPSDAKKPKSEITQLSERNKPAAPSPAVSDGVSNDVLELFATTTEMEGLIDEENQVPSVTEQEDLRSPEKDAELLELEMRARAIRSLLRARGNALPKLDKGPESEALKK